MNFSSLKSYVGYLINNIFAVLVVGIPLIYCYLNNINGDYVELNNYKEVSKFFVFLLFLSPEIILPKGIKGDYNIIRFYVLTLFIFLSIVSIIFIIVPIDNSRIFLIILFNLIGFFFYSVAVAQSKLRLYLFAQGFSLFVSSIFLFIFNSELLSFYFLYSFLLATLSFLLFYSFIKNVTFTFSAYSDYFRSFKFYYLKFYKFALTTVIGVIIGLYSRFYFQDLYGDIRYESYDLINSTITLLLGVLSQSYISYRLFNVSKVSNFRIDFVVFSILLFCLLAIFSIDFISLRFFKLEINLSVLCLLFLIESIKFLSLKYTVYFMDNDRFELLGIVAIFNLFFVGICIHVMKYFINDFLITILLVNLATVLFNLLLSHFIFTRLNQASLPINKNFP